jgi:hypothetical protein
MYGLMVNFGTQSQIPLSRPNPQVLAQPDQGGGSSNEIIGPGNSGAGNRSTSNRQGFSDVIRSHVVGGFSWGDLFAVSSRPSRASDPGVQTLTSDPGDQTLTVSVSSPSASSGIGWSPLLTTNFTTAFLNRLSSLPSPTGSVKTSSLPSQAAPSRVLQALDNAIMSWGLSDRWSLLGDGQDPADA